MVMKEMGVLTNLGKAIYFSTLYYIVEHDIAKVEKKKMAWRAYLAVVAAIDDTD